MAQKRETCGGTLLVILPSERRLVEGKRKLSIVRSMVRCLTTTLKTVDSAKEWMVFRDERRPTKRAETTKVMKHRQITVGKPVICCER